LELTKDKLSLHRWISGIRAFVDQLHQLAAAHQNICHPDINRIGLYFWVINIMTTPLVCNSVQMC